MMPTANVIRRTNSHIVPDLCRPSMKLGIMQPYLFPYLGYFQLMAAVDRFVIYDDVAFMKQGWVNRNQILMGGTPCLFSVPIQDVSSFTAIRDTAVSSREYGRWREKFFKTLHQAYRKAPHYGPTSDLVARVLNGNTDSIRNLAVAGLVEVSHHLGLSTSIVETSSIYGNGHLRGQERVLDICRLERTTWYLNAPGGRQLYSPLTFSAQGITLRFLRSRFPPYPQFRKEFVPGLSIIDLLMFNSASDIRHMLNECEFDE